MKFKIYYLILLCCLFAACTSQPNNVKYVKQLPKIFPDYVGVTVPVDIAPLDFTMASEDYSTIDVVVNGSRGGVLHVNGEYADFDIDAWHALLKQNKGGKLIVRVCAEKDGEWTGFRDFTIDVSNDELGEWGVTYRRIAPSYELYSSMGLYQRDLSNFDETELIANSRTSRQCLNCHTANKTSAKQYVFHVRGEHGATGVATNGKIELLQAKNEDLGGSMVYPYWHPGGRYCAFSTNKTSQMFHSKLNKRIEVFDTESDVFVYDTKEHAILRDTLIMKKYWAENTPAFSPDGKWLYFTTAKRQVYPDNYNKEKYSLCRVSFDEKTGRLGQKVDTLINTNQTGKSVTWPRLSYDGKYLMYTQIDYGYFSIWHPEADLWMLDLQTMQTRPIAEANSKRCESFHNWSTNSRWFLFTSRRDDGLYTKLYFSHVDAQGKVSKPFLLPQRNPREYYRMLMYSYNTPDFVAEPIKANPRELGQAIESDKRTSTKVITN